MYLQCNTKGAWKRVLTFCQEHQPEVRQLAAEMGMLSEVAGEPTAWRVMDDFAEVVAVWADSAIGWKDC